MEDEGMEDEGMEDEGMEDEGMEDEGMADTREKVWQQRPDWLIKIWLIKWRGREVNEKIVILTASYLSLTLFSLCFCLSFGKYITLKIWV